MRLVRQNRQRGSLMGIAFLGLVGTSWQRPEVALAQTASPSRAPESTTATAPVAELRVVGTEASLLALQQVLGRKRLGKVELRWTRVESFAPQQILSLFSRDKAIVHCWFDLSDPEQAHLYFVAPTHDRFMMRELDLKHRFGTFELESLAQIVETSIDVLLTDNEAGMSRHEVEAALGQPTAPPLAAPVKGGVQLVPRAPEAPKAHYGWLVDATWVVRQYSSEVQALFGPRLAMGVERARPGTRQWLLLSAGYSFASRVKGDVASADLDRLDVALSVSHLFAATRSPPLAAGPCAAVGLGYVGATPVAGEREGSYDLTTPPHSLEPYLGMGADFALGLGTHSSLSARLDMEYVLRPVEHVLLVNGAEEALTAGRRCRLGASLGFQFR